MPKINELATIAAAGAKLVASDSSGDAGNVLASDFATASQGSLADTAVQPNDLATVATTGAYADLSGTPTLGTAAAADTGDFATSAQGSLAATAVQPGDLATVATTGAYADLSGTPTLGTAAAADTGDFATSAQGGLADTALQPGAIGSTVQGHDDLLDDMAALSDPNADRMLFWDDSAGKVEWLTVGANLSISGTTLNASGGGGGGGGGDMDSAIYDPNNVASDVFDMDNMADGTGKVAMTASERSKLSGIEAGADVTDATNVAAAGAVMDGDFSADGMMARTGAGTYASRTITGTSQEITVTNGDGKSGNPTLALASQVTASLGLADTAVQPGDLATVATSGAYSDLSGTPTLGTAAAADTGDFATAAQGSLAATAVQPGALGNLAYEDDADGVPYNNVTSGLVATDVQAAIDEVVVLAGGGGGFTGMQGFTSSGTFTPAAGVDRVFVIVQGGGQGGRQDSASNLRCGNGGDCVMGFIDVTGAVSVTIGAGSAGKSGSDPSAGGDTSVGALAVAKGGSSATTSSLSGGIVLPGQAPDTGVASLGGASGFGSFRGSGGSASVPVNTAGQAGFVIVMW